MQKRNFSSNFFTKSIDDEYSKKLKQMNFLLKFFLKYFCNINNSFLNISYKKFQFDFLFENNFIL